jgi:hypothetical protein
MLKVRNSSTNTRGGSFDYATIQSVWNKAQIVAGVDASVVSAK